MYGAIPDAMTIWLVMVGLVAIGCGLTAAPALRRQRRATRAHLDRARLRRVQLGAHAADLGRHAEEVAVAAARAAVTAQRRQDEWEAVRRAREAAWRTYSAADAAARRTGLAAAFPVSSAPPTAVELRARERYLHRVATEAYRRGELSLADLSDVLSHRNGWDPRHHPADHEVALRRIARERLLAGYEAVAVIEGTARHHAEVAAAAAATLGHEASSARARAERAAEILATHSRHSRRRAVAIGHASVLVPGQ
jgi:hypothetical protein